MWGRVYTVVGNGYVRPFWCRIGCWWGGGGHHFPGGSKGGGGPIGVTLPGLLDWLGRAAAAEAVAQDPVGAGQGAAPRATAPAAKMASPRSAYAKIVELTATRLDVKLTNY